jgi:16S rRNA (guanine1207-N2)-methyltransferase
MAVRDEAAMGELAARLEAVIKARLPSGGTMAWIDPPPGRALGLLGAKGFSTRFDHASSLGCEFGAWFSPPAPVDMVLVTMPKGRQACRMLLAMASEAVKVGGDIVLLGETRLGVKSAAADLATVCGTPIEKLGHAAHGAAYVAQLGAAVTPAGLSPWWQSWTLDGLEIASLPGVFSAEALDAGTAFFLQTLDAAFVSRHNKIMDYGCGAGVIAAWVARLGGDVEAMDVSALAVASTAETARRNGLTVSVLASDTIDQTRRRHDAILSNPPFHDGRKVDLDVARAFLTKARTHLKPGGTIRLVSNRFLPYAEPLADVFGSVETVAENTRFRVLQAGGRSRKSPGANRRADDE